MFNQMSASRKMRRSNFRFFIGVVRREVHIQIGGVQLDESSLSLFSKFSILFFEFTVSDSMVSDSAQYCSLRISANFCVPIPNSIISSFQHLSQTFG